MTRLLLTTLLLLPGTLRADEPKLVLTADEKAVLELTNQERAKEKLPPLKPNPLLMRIAREHSINMAKQDKLAHELDDKNPSDRAKDVGYKGLGVGENCAYGFHPYPAKGAMKSWMDSKGHRENILGKEYDEIGIGTAKNQKGKVYWTQVFGRSK